MSDEQQAPERDPLVKKFAYEWVCFNHDVNDKYPYLVTDITDDCMIELEGMSGLFAPSCFHLVPAPPTPGADGRYCRHHDDDPAHTKECYKPAADLAPVAQRPKIVCLCGSTRFANEFMKAQFDETVAGNIVLTVGCFPRKPDGSWDRMVVTDEQKIALDTLHFRKIELADEVFVINVGGYIGESTQNEVNHARKLGKTIRWLEYSFSQ